MIEDEVYNKALSELGQAKETIRELRRSNLTLTKFSGEALSILLCLYSAFKSEKIYNMSDYVRDELSKIGINADDALKRMK